MFHPHLARLLTASAALALLIAAVPLDHARAQVRLEAAYAISVARIPVGNVTVTADIGGDYTVTASGRASGAARMVVSGEGSLTAQGSIKDGRAQPSSYRAKTTADDESLDVKMTFEDGNVKDLEASAAPASKDRVDVTKADRQDVVDPLSAMLVPAAETGEALSEAACQRTLRVFDGRRRFDLKLTFKRMDKVKADKGYAGPVVVCAVTFQPVAGHRTSSTLVKFMTEGHELELALAPISGTKMLAPFRMSVSHMLGNLVVQASRFDVTASPSVRASAATGRAP